jgi:hypothetical protein
MLILSLKSPTSKGEFEAAIDGVTRGAGRFGATKAGLQSIFNLKQESGLLVIPGNAYVKSDMVGIPFCIPNI